MRHRQDTVIRCWAGLDLAVTGLLVVPPVAAGFIGLLLNLNALLGGTDAAALVNDIALPFICIAGALGVLWALARLLTPTRLFGIMDTAGRAWVGALIAYFVLAQDTPGIFLLFVLTEWAGTVHQAMVLHRDGGSRDADPV